MVPITRGMPNAHYACILETFQNKVTKRIKKKKRKEHCISRGMHWKVLLEKDHLL